MTKSVTIKQDPKNEIVVEVLATHIRAISAGIKQLRRGPINDKALILLIQYAAPGEGGSPIPQRTIKNVLDGIEGLAAACLKKPNG